MIAERLRETRGTRSQEMVDDLCGLAKGSCAQYEGGRKPTSDNLIKLANGLQVSTDWLCGLVNAIFVRYDGLQLASITANEVQQTKIKDRFQQNKGVIVYETFGGPDVLRLVIPASQMYLLGDAIGAIQGEQRRASKTS